MTDEEKSMNLIKAIYDDGEAEINGRVYKFHGTTHAKRRSVFAFFSSIQHDIARGDFNFLDSEGFQKIEKIMVGMVSIEGNILAKNKDHWEKYPEDYLKFITSAMGVISYPFLQGGLTA